MSVHPALLHHGNLPATCEGSEVSSASSVGPLPFVFYISMEHVLQSYLIRNYPVVLFFYGFQGRVDQGEFYLKPECFSVTV